MGDKSFIQDYTLVCRTCLQSNVEMLSLSALISDNVQEENSKISYMECLKMCIPVVDENTREMPARICLECASALQVAYWFMKNARQAQELLKVKLKEIRRKKQHIELELAVEEVRKPKRYRCKICNVKVETKRSLKDHVKLHLDIIVYNCQLCSFESHYRNSLSDHYTEVHGVEATKEQLKPKTKTPATSSLSTSTTSTLMKNQNFLVDSITNDHYQILPEATQSAYESILTTCSSSGSLQVTSLATTNQTDFTALTTTPFSPLEDDLSTNVNSDLNVADEFIVLADGSVEKVMGKGVVIEYINATDDGRLCLDNDLVLDNIIQVQNIDNNEIIQNQQSDIIQMDVDDIIIEDAGDAPEEITESIPLPLEEEKIPATIIEQRKKIVCKICTKDFSTQEQLKNHMLTHNEIPHFFCDQCKFYTFFKIDLHQHYKSKHNLQPTSKQLQPKNKQKPVKEVYSCDLCFYQCDLKVDLKRHYNNKHNIEAGDIHLKPTLVEKSNASLSPLSAKAKAAATVTSVASTVSTKNVKIQPIEKSSPDYPNGLNCRKCHEVFYWRNKLYEHYKLHNAEEAALKQEKQFAKVQHKQTSKLYQSKTKPLKGQIQAIISQPQLDTINTSTYTNLDTLALNVNPNNNNTISSMAPLTPSSSSTYTLPSDAIPQIVETDQTIENDMDFDFNGDDDALFQDFDDDVDVENDSDENDSEFRNVLLTSDDDFEDMLQDQNNLQNAETVTPESYCAHCQKGFLSQYQFENHMFVHRGLAPYRCEMCTNLYNKKRCLIRHYKAVHKSVPTRDMIQAKGDKVFVENTPIDNLNLVEIHSFMCAKCPHESTDLGEMQSHLKSSHNIADESYIMKKLPFECPRCIRSFANKVKLLRHLERNHSSTPINQHQIRFDTATDSPLTVIATSSTSSTEITTSINNHVNMMKSEPSETNASCGYDMFIKQENRQQQYINTSRKRNELSIEDAVAPNIILPDLKDSIALSSLTSLASNETSNNSSCTYNQFVRTSASSTRKETGKPSASTPSALDQNGSDQPLFKCKLCLFTCYNIQSLNEHSKRIECRKFSVDCPGDRMLFECEICHCNYKTMYLLKHHLKRHIGRKFFCVNCPKTFISKLELEAHRRVHSGERPHKCDACPKSFRYVHHLKRHKDSVHFGKRHACTEPNCGRKFTTLAQLKVHIWTHNGIVPYKCKFCERLFKKRLLLRKHCIKAHKITLSEEEMAEIFRNSLGYTNPHDFTVTICNGKMLRRGDLETMGASGVIKSEFK